jgi:hypothetical protein
MKVTKLFQDVLAMAETKINQKNQDILLVKLPTNQISRFLLKCLKIFVDKMSRFVLLLTYWNISL